MVHWIRLFHGITGLLSLTILLAAHGRARSEPFIEAVDPPVVRRGVVSRVTLRGNDLHQAVDVWMSLPGIPLSAAPVAGSSRSTEAVFDILVPAHAPLGLFGLRLATRSGLSNVHPVLVDELPVTKLSPATEFRSTQSRPLVKVQLPCCLAAPCRPESVDRYAIQVAARQTLSLEVVGSRFGKDYDPLITIRDRSGRIVARRDNDPGLFYDCRFAHTFESSGQFIVEVRDARFKGDRFWNYILRMGSFPAANVVVPAAAKPDTTSVVWLPEEANSQITLTVPARPRMPVFFQDIRHSPAEPATWVPLHAASFPATLESEPNDHADETATLATIPTTLNGVLSSPGDRDCFAFRMNRGQTINITAQSREIGSAADLELILTGPDGGELQRLDDASYVHRKVAVPIEARTIFAARKDGLHCLMIREMASSGGPSFTYHVNIHATVPSMQLSSDVSRLTVPQQSWQPLPIRVVRDRLSGPIELTLTGAPTGVTLEPSTIPADRNEIVCRLQADAATMPGLSTLEIVGHWKSADGQHQATGVVTVHPLIDRQQIDKDRRLYSLRENQLRLPPSLRSRFALLITPPAPFSIDLPEASIILTKYQTGTFPIATRRQPGFASPIRFAVSGGQIGIREQERDNVYAEIPDATVAQPSVDGVFFNRINTRYEKVRVDLRATAMQVEHSVTLVRTFELDVRPGFRPAFETGYVNAIPGETLTLQLNANRTPTYNGRIILTPYQDVGLDIPEETVILPDRQQVEITIPIPADRAPGRISLRWQSTGQVGHYEENIIEPYLTIDVKSLPEKKKT